MNVMKADCGFNPQDANRPVTVTMDEIGNVEGFDVSGLTVAIVDLSTATSDVSIEELIGMVDGKVYTFVAVNGADGAHGLTFPAGHLSSGAVEVVAGATVVYRVWTDGYRVYVDGSVYSGS